MYRIDGILPPYVFIRNDNDKLERVRLSEFNNRPVLNGSVEKLNDGTYNTLTDATDVNCPGGVCPIK